MINIFLVLSSREVPSKIFLKYFSSSLHKDQFFNFIEKKSQEGMYDF